MRRCPGEGDVLRFVSEVSVLLVQEDVVRGAWIVAAAWPRLDLEAAEVSPD